MQLKNKTTWQKTFKKTEFDVCDLDAGCSTAGLNGNFFLGECVWWAVLYSTAQICG